MNTPSNLKYAKSHEWVQFINDATARIGITDYAQGQLGDIVFINLPLEGDDVVMDAPFTDIESVKAVSDVFSPVTGSIVAVNQELDDAPEKINSDPYGAWIIEVGGIIETEDLMDAAAYEAFCASEGA